MLINDTLLTRSYFGREGSVRITPEQKQIKFCIKYFPRSPVCPTAADGPELFPPALIFVSLTQALAGDVEHVATVGAHFYSIAANI